MPAKYRLNTIEIDLSTKEGSHKDCPLFATGTTNTSAVAVGLTGVKISKLARVNSLDLFGVNRRGNRKTTEQLKARE